MTKRLLDEEERAWNLISQDRSQVHWDNVVFEIEEHFMRIACCSARSLSQQVTCNISMIASCCICYSSS